MDKKLNQADNVEKYLRNNPDKKAVKDRFLENFTLCEMQCKEIILSFWHSRGEKLDVNDTDKIQLRPGSINNALGTASKYQLSEDFLLKLFGGKGNVNNPYKTKGKYSVKMLRDNITHRLLISAIDEVYDRKDEIFKIMQEFREKIASVDD